MSQSLDNKFLELRRNYIASQFGKLNDVQKQAVFYTQAERPPFWSIELPI